MLKFSYPSIPSLTPIMKLPHLFLGLAGALAISALALWFIRPGVPEKPQEKTNSPLSLPTPVESPPVVAEPIQDAAQEKQEIATGHADPAELIRRIAGVFESGDVSAFEKFLGHASLDEVSLAMLRELLATKPRLKQPDGIREVGELELNQRTRWSLELESGASILLDLKREGGLWVVEKIKLPARSDQKAWHALTDDSLAAADAFLQAVLNQNFEVARTLVDAKAVSDTKIAGLCILFEEGMYRLRKSKPLRSMLQKPDLAGYLANIEAADGSEDAGISLTLRKNGNEAQWLVSEINLDRLLADYARRIAGGDVYYSPLVKNPAGGETLALYFGFDEDEVSPRTRRQLEIVARILRSDSAKKITLSGHTDALGTRNYNDDLSARRADVVRDMLIEAGVSTAQIVTVAKGSSQPRRPNVTETGADNPDGRKVNRRTEIYLDF